jgi:hypothetical protein
MDEAGNVVVTGVAFRKVGDSSVSYPCGSQSSTGEWVSFAARLDNTGECVWVKTKLGDARFAATVDDDGSTYLTGVDSAASFTSKLDANGDELWRAEGTGGDSIEVDANGNVFFARSDGIYYPDLCVVSLDGSGAERWNQCYGQLWKGDSYARFRGLSVNAAGAFALAGQYGDSLSFGGPALSAGGESAMFLAALDVDNQHMFSKSIPEITSDSGGNNPAPVIPAISADGKVALAGGFWRSIDFGAGQQQAIGTGDDDTDAFVAVYGSTGELVAHAQYGGDSSDWVRSAHYDATGALLIAGPFSSAIDFGEGPLEATGSDGDPRTAWLFVARLLP